jgi:thiamine kinase-like enzyme
LITRWIDEPVWTPEQTRVPKNLKSIAILLRRLHRLPAPPQVRTLDLSSLINGYWDTLRIQQTDLPPEFSALQATAVKLLDGRSTGEGHLCHNDLHAGNIIGTGPTVRLLDWEYSGIGEPLFDLASYTQSNDLNASQCKFLLQAYGATDRMRERFSAEQRLFDWTCALWLAVSGAHKTSIGAQRLAQLIGRFASRCEPSAGV